MKSNPKDKKYSHDLLDPQLMTGSILAREIFGTHDGCSYINLRSSKDFFEQYCKENPLDIIKMMVKHREK